MKILNMVGLILFNLLEIFCIYLMSMLVNINIEICILICVVWFASRLNFGKALHYKSPYKCFILTLTLFLTLFLMFKINLIYCIAITVLSGYIMTHGSDFIDFSLWSPKDEPSKYQKLIDFMKYNPLDDRLLKYEKYLKENDTLMYLVFKYKFIEKLSFGKISDDLEISTNKITEILDKIYETLKYELLL